METPEEDTESPLKRCRVGAGEVPCQREGCSFAVTWHRTHCCGACAHGGGHGKRCEGKVFSAPAALPVDEDVLSPEQRQEFKDRGYTILRDAVPSPFLRDALRAINHALAAGGHALPTNVACDVMNGSPAIWSALNVLLGHKAKRWDKSCQVALRFPESPDMGHHEPDVGTGTRYHIDGMGKNSLCPFSVLVGVALSDQSEPSMGNLHVFPGSHLNEELHTYYRDKIDDETAGEADESKPDLGESEQVLLSKGDVVLAHQLLAHRIGVNTSEHIRYQLYFRAVHEDHESLRDRIVDDPWVEFAI